MCKCIRSATDIERFPDIRESVDSLCRDGTDTTRPFSHIEWPRTLKRSLKVLLDTYTYSRGVSVPARTLKVRKIHSYNRGRDSMSKVGGFGVHKVGGYSHSF